MRIFLLSILLPFIFGTCVEPINLNPTFKPTIVIEGLITDQPGPYHVKITRAIPLSINSQLQTSTIYETGATVIIQDDIGNSETLIEKSSGIYYTSLFQGIVGRTYSLLIKTSDGSAYESIPEKMMPVGEFSNLKYEFVQKEPPPPFLPPWTSLVPLDKRNIKSNNGFKVYLDSEVIPEQENRVWWRWTGTFKISSFPSLQKEYVTDSLSPDSSILVPNVDICSGLINLNRHTKHSQLFPIGPCTCCECWVTEYNITPLISDPKFINNGKIAGFNIAFIEANRRTFYDKYYLEVEQLSVTQTIYSFWKNIKTQENNSSNLFQTPPPKTGGNFKPTLPNSKLVIGYFAASAVKKHFITIERNDVPYNVGIIDTLALDCRNIYKYSSSVKPLFW